MVSCVKYINKSESKHRTYTSYKKINSKCFIGLNVKYKIIKLFAVDKVNVGGPYKVGVGSLAKSHWASALEFHPDSLFFFVLLS